MAQNARTKRLSDAALSFGPMAKSAGFIIRARRVLGARIPFRVVKVQEAKSIKAGAGLKGAAPKPYRVAVGPKLKDPKAEKLFQESVARRHEALELLARY